MPSVVWSPRALADLSRLHGLLVAKNPDAARRAIHAIRQGVTALARHPGIGRPADGMAPAFRDWWVPFGDNGYVVRYRIDGQIALILAIRHGREIGF